MLTLGFMAPVAPLARQFTPPIPQSLRKKLTHPSLTEILHPLRVRRAAYICKLSDGNSLFSSGGAGDDKDNGNKGSDNSGTGDSMKGEGEDEAEDGEELNIGDGDTWSIKFSFRKAGKDENDQDADEDGDGDINSDAANKIDAGGTEADSTGTASKNVVLSDLIDKGGGDNEGTQNEIYQGVKSWSLDQMEELQQLVSEEAQEAMKRTMMGMFGSLPTMTYDVQIGTDKEGVAKVMLASLSNGYMLRNAEVRMSLNESLSGTRLGKETTAKSPTDGDQLDAGKKGDEPDYMENVPNRSAIKRSAITGKVEWWDAQAQKQAHMDAGEYIGKLESEVDLLRSRLEAKKILSNRLLEFISTISPERLGQLQSGLGTKALSAMKLVIQRTLGVVPSFKIQQNYLGNRDYFAQLALWSMMIGYIMKDIENRIEIERLLTEEPKDSNRPPSSNSREEGEKHSEAT